MQLNSDTVYSENVMQVKSFHTDLIAQCALGEIMIDNETKESENDLLMNGLPQVLL